jgi:hypothetical protein
VDDNDNNLFMTRLGGRDVFTSEESAVVSHKGTKTPPPRPVYELLLLKKKKKKKLRVFRTSIRARALLASHRSDPE